MKKRTIQMILFTLLPYFSGDLFARNDQTVSIDRIDGFLRPSVGVTNFFRENGLWEFRIEGFPNTKLWGVARPYVGVSYNWDKDFFGYAGLGVEMYFNKYLFFFPSLAIGYYRHGKGVNLGHPLEFRTGLEVGWKFSNEMRTSLGLYHMSNFEIGDKNPGTESVSVMVALPFKL